MYTDPKPAPQPAKTKPPHRVPGALAGIRAWRRSGTGPAPSASHRRWILSGAVAVAASASVMLAPMAASAAASPKGSAHHATTASQPGGTGVPVITQHPAVRSCAIPVKPGEDACFAIRRTDIKSVRESALAPCVVKLVAEGGMKCRSHGERK